MNQPFGKKLMSHPANVKTLLSELPPITGTEAAHIFTVNLPDLSYRKIKSSISNKDLRAQTEKTPPMNIIL